MSGEDGSGSGSCFHVDWHCRPADTAIAVAHGSLVCSMVFVINNINYMCSL
jgi:hypothetical protein